MMKIIPDRKYPNMYRVQWPNGDISVGSDNPKPWEIDGHYGFYNYTRAKEFLRREGIEEYDRGVTVRSPLGRAGELADELFDEGS